MSIEKRIAKLEQFQKKAESMVLTGVMYFHEHCIFVDGVEYNIIDDVPQELRDKYEDILPA